MVRRKRSTPNPNTESKEYHIHLLLPIHTAMGRGIFDGIVEVAGHRLDWHCGVIRELKQTDVPTIGPPAADAVLGGVRHHLAKDWDTDQRRRVVNTSRGYDDGEIANVICDDQRIGRMAADHLLGKNLQAFAYCGGASGRESGFAERIRGAGRPYQCLLPDEHPETDLESWLETLPPRTGIMGFNDDMAAMILWAAQRIGRAVPEDLAVVGVDADPVQSFLAPVPISSVDPNFHRVGYRAAELLDRILKDGHDARGETILVPPAGVVEQGSSDFPGIDDPQVIKAARFIRRHACDGILVRDVVTEIPLSRRPLERRFRAAFGRSMLEEIHRVRVAEAARMLKQTELPVGVIARQVGFHGNDRLTEAFRTVLSMTPADYRRDESGGEV